MRRCFLVFISLVFFLPSVFAQNDSPEPVAFSAALLTPENGFENDPKTMMKSYLLGEIAEAKNVWTERYGQLKTIEQIKIYQDERKRFFLDRLGKTWDRDAPLNPQILKTFEKGTAGKDAYKVEMVVFESVPGFYVSGAVFVPDPTRFSPPYPAVLIVCGHADEGKAYDLYQRVPALAASNGLLAMSIDPIDQGERSQRLTPEGKPIERGVPAHNVIGAGSILLGRNAATFEYWDMVRAIDYLQSRPDVVRDKIGVTGQSGGGTQTSYIMALDDRVAVAAPSCYVVDLFNLVGGLGPQDAEQNIFGQLAFGMDHADYCIMRAPKPTLIETCTEDFFPVQDAWSACRYAKRIFDRFGDSEKMSIVESEGKHGWHKTLREATVRWMLRWLTGRDEQVFEADDMPVFKPEEFVATPRGEVLLLDGARSAYDLNRDYNEELLALRKSKNEKQSREEWVAEIRRLTDVRPMEEIQNDYSVEQLDDVAEPAPFREVKRFLVRTKSGMPLPVLCFLPEGEPKGTTIFLHDKGKTADLRFIEQRVRDGRKVLAVDLRGMGETQAVGPQYYKHAQFGTDGTDYYLAYLLGKSYLGMRTEDLLAVAQWEFSLDGERSVDVAAMGEISGVVALHAAVLEPEFFNDVILEQPPRSWYDVVKAGDSPYPITNLVHGALLEYDIPDLHRLLKESKSE